MSGVDCEEGEKYTYMGKSQKSLCLGLKQIARIKQDTCMR
jgi:hypothetical protein